MIRLLAALLGTRKPPHVPPRLPICWCGCIAEIHVHHRPGRDCGHCGPESCRAYRPITGRLTWAQHRHLDTL